MIRCKNCDNRFDYNARPCVICGSDVKIDREDVDFTRRELERALDQKRSAKVFSCRHLLADAGITSEQREFAKLIEAGEGNIYSADAAKSYYYKAARKNDAYSAYRYSMLTLDENPEHACFWLKFSAVLGSIDAYPKVADLLSKNGNEALATYYYALAAACDDTQSVVTMAKRYADGIGAPISPEYAKWYLDKMRIPPISAIKLAYKLRSIKSMEPPKIKFPDEARYIKALADEGKAFGFFTAYFNLTVRLADMGDANAEAAAGILLTEAKGCRQDLSLAKKYLHRGIEHKNPAAAIYLGEEYLSGRNFEQNTSLAIKYFERAADLGYPGAYEKIGDIYREGRLVEKNMALAIDLYERAAAGGSESARKKAEEFKKKREESYLFAYRLIEIRSSINEDEAEASFKAAAVATALGEIRAAKLLAKCYAAGIGTECDRRSAFYWYKHAADNGDREAYLPLALCYSRGFGTNFSCALAVKYLKLSIDLGFNGAWGELELLNRRKTKRILRSVYSNAMSLIYQKQYERAAKILISIEGFGYPKAIYTLGCLYEFGIGVPKTDRSRAIECYDAAKRGNAEFGSFTDVSSLYRRKILQMVNS